MADPSVHLALKAIVDSLSLALDAWNVIDFAHHELHRGAAFNVNRENLDLDLGVDEDLLLEVGAVTCHLTFAVAASAGCHLFLFENPTFTTGVAITPVNRNRTGTPPAATMGVSHTPVDPGAAVDGDQLYQEHFGVGGVPSLRAAGVSRGTQEWPLKTSTKYLFRVTSLVENTTIDINLEWYERNI